MHAKPIIDLRFRSVHRSFLLINPTRGPRLRNVRHPAPERVRAPARCLRAKPDKWPFGRCARLLDCL